MFTLLNSSGTLGINVRLPKHRRITAPQTALPPSHFWGQSHHTGWLAGWLTRKNSSPQQSTIAWLRRTGTRLSGILGEFLFSFHSRRLLFCAPAQFNASGSSPSIQPDRSSSSSSAARLRGLGWLSQLRALAVALAVAAGLQCCVIGCPPTFSARPAFCFGLAWFVRSLERDTPPRRKSRLAGCCGPPLRPGFLGLSVWSGPSLGRPVPDWIRLGNTTVSGVGRFWGRVLRFASCPHFSSMCVLCSVALL